MKCFEHLLICKQSIRNSKSGVEALTVTLFVSKLGFRVLNECDAGAESVISVSLTQDSRKDRHTS